MGVVYSPPTRRGPRTHDCVLPEPMSHVAGTIWRCDECGAYWLVDDLDLLPDWRWITERKARRLMKRGGR